MSQHKKTSKAALEDRTAAAIPATSPSIKGKVYFPSFRRASSREDCCPQLAHIVEWQTIGFCPKEALCLESPPTWQASPGDPWPCSCTEPDSALGAWLQENGGSSNKSRQIWSCSSSGASVLNELHHLSSIAFMVVVGASVPLTKTQVEFCILCICFVIMYGVLWVDFY